jgi:hypothetical protein
MSSVGNSVYARGICRVLLDGIIFSTDIDSLNGNKTASPREAVTRLELSSTSSSKR